jgi:hypothetical protein
MSPICHESCLLYVMGHDTSVQYSDSPDSTRLFRARWQHTPPRFCSSTSMHALVPPVARQSVHVAPVYVS